MYSVRTFTKDNVEKNRLLGKEYKVFKKDFKEGANNESFEAIHNNVFAGVIGNKSFDTDATVFIVGDITVPLYAGEVAYIMSPNGQTYSKVSDR